MKNSINYNLLMKYGQDSYNMQIKYKEINAHVKGHTCSSVNSLAQHRRRCMCNKYQGRRELHFEFGACVHVYRSKSFGSAPTISQRTTSTWPFENGPKNTTLNEKSTEAKSVLFTLQTLLCVFYLFIIYECRRISLRGINGWKIFRVVVPITKKEASYWLEGRVYRHGHSSSRVSNCHKVLRCL